MSSFELFGLFSNILGHLFKNRSIDMSINQRTENKNKDLIRHRNWSKMIQFKWIKIHAMFGVCKASVWTKSKMSIDQKIKKKCIDFYVTLVFEIN